jgi:hypothetical protein
MLFIEAIVKVEGRLNEDKRAEKHDDEKNKKEVTFFHFEQVEFGSKYTGFVSWLTKDEMD